MTGWQPIESAPKDDSPVLVTARDGKRTIVGEAHFDPANEAWWWAGENWGDYHAESLPARGWRATHWMPLPDPPAEG
jgi:hypothetical protein